MSLGRAVNEALDAATGPGVVHAETDGASADVDVADVDRLGVRVKRVQVTRAAPFDLAEAARELPDRLRSLPERIEPVEVDPGLGGAVLRSRPEDLEGGEFYEIGIHGDRELDLRRIRGGPGVDREPADFTMTRKQLGRLVDELA